MRCFENNNIVELNATLANEEWSNEKEYTNQADKQKTIALKLENIKNADLAFHVKKILDNPKAFKSAFVKRSAISTLIPIALVGYILPKTVRLMDIVGEVPNMRQRRRLWRLETSSGI